jgi:dTDP-4-dehydrorhamnose reductase
MSIKMQILIIGHNGMLGQMAKAYFEQQGHDVITTSLYFKEDNYNEWSVFIQSYPEAVILNCIGRIKQKTNDIHDLLWANAILPLQLANLLQSKQFLIHPSTDCVFEGDKGSPYLISDLSDAKDAYGWSKRLGEVALLNQRNAIVVRVSIIGTDHSETPKGLLGWFLNQPQGAVLNGFINHLWNGITTLEWCKQVEQILQNSSPYRDIFMLQLGTEKLHSKYDMLLLFQKVFLTNYTINKTETSVAVDRTMLPTRLCKSLEEQLIELKEFTAKI